MSTNEYREALIDLIAAVDKSGEDHDLYPAYLSAAYDRAKALLERPEPEPNGDAEIRWFIGEKPYGRPTPMDLIEQAEKALAKSGDPVSAFASDDRIGTVPLVRELLSEPSPRITREEACKMLFARDHALRDVVATNDPTDDELLKLNDATNVVLEAMGVER